MGKLSVQEALDYCLSNPDGLGEEELLAEFPEYREELQPLLALSSNIAHVTHLEPPPVPDDRRAAMKARLQAAAQTRQPVLLTSQPTANGARTASKPKQRWWTLLRRPAFALGTTMAVAFLFLWWAAATALPDSPFYGVKIASENLLLNFSGDSIGKARSHLRHANTRLDDIRAMEAQEKLGAAGPAIDNYGYHLQSCSTLLNTTGQSRNSIAEQLGISIQNCDQMFRGFGASLDTIPGTTQSKITSLYKNMGDISMNIGVQPPEPPQELPVPILETPTPSTTPSPQPSPTSAIENPTDTPSLPVSVTKTAAATRAPQSSSPTPARISPTVPRISPTPLTSRTTPTPNSTLSPITFITPTPPLPTSTIPPADTVVATKPPLPPAPTNTPSPTPQTAPTSPPPTSEPPAHPPAATPTQKPVSQNSCNLTLREVSFSCDANGVSWSVEVENNDRGVIVGEWTVQATLKINRGGSQHMEESGASTFRPGGNSLTGQLRYPPALEVEEVRLRLILEQLGSPQCQVSSRQIVLEDCDGRFATQNTGKPKDKDIGR